MGARVSKKGLTSWTERAEKYISLYAIHLCILVCVVVLRCIKVNKVLYNMHETGINNVIKNLISLDFKRGNTHSRLVVKGHLDRLICVQASAKLRRG